MRARPILALAAGLFLAAFARDEFDLWIEATRLPPLVVSASVQVLDREGAPGVWPSDHFGVYVRFAFAPR